MFINKFDKNPDICTPATLKKYAVVDPLLSVEIGKTNEETCFNEIEVFHKAFTECENGKYKGPSNVDTPYYFVICFESNAQQDKFRSEMHLMNHGNDHWSSEAFFGTLELLKGRPKSKSLSSFKDKFSKLSKFAQQKPQKEISAMRQAQKDINEKLGAYLEKCNNLCICFPDQKSLNEGRALLGMPEDNQIRINSNKYIHIEDLLPIIKDKFGVELDVPIVPFRLRPVHKPDPVLNALVLS